MCVEVILCNISLVFWDTVYIAPNNGEIQRLDGACASDCNVPTINEETADDNLIRYVKQVVNAFGRRGYVTLYRCAQRRLLVSGDVKSLRPV